MNLIGVKDALRDACQGRPVKLVAVSKLQSIDSIKTAYDLGQRDFGENYSQELIEKSQVLKESCPEIRWHFIGALQSNKIRTLLKSFEDDDSLWAVETVDSMGKFDKIVKALQETGRNRTRPLELFLQVNISQEDNKHGLKSKEEIIQIYRHYLHLKKESADTLNYSLNGLMMIGEIEASERDFAKMIQLRRELEVEIDWNDCKLSMGMSGDYELAARMGSDIVRIGSAIFGDRPMKQK
jgi:pyridoxal phosphate enzyme (YggS family)